MEDTKIFQFKNCYIMRDHKILRDDLWVRNGRIVNPEPIFYEEKKMPDVVYDCDNMLIAPGYIDLQINGKSITLLLYLFNFRVLSYLYIINLVCLSTFF